MQNVNICFGCARQRAAARRYMNEGYGRVLAAAPTHAGAKANLAVLDRQQGTRMS